VIGALGSPAFGCGSGYTLGVPTDEGYIKYQARWTRSKPLPDADLEELRFWRERLRGHGLIGEDASGIGFGNVSRRWDADHRFVITGNATGGESSLRAEHFALVTDVDIDANRLSCVGPILASSEAMSHAVIYRACPWVNAVLHVHDARAWAKLLHRLPTTSADVPYGTPEMARAIEVLLHTTHLVEQRLFVTEGHQDGIFAFGESLDLAGGVLLSHVLS
jgi:hypothetical protein